MTEPSPRSAANPILVLLLLLEAAVGLLVTLLNVVTSRALGHEFLPFESILIPGGFGVLCLIAAVGIWQRRSLATGLTAVMQLAVLALGVIGLIDNSHPLLWLTAAFGILGLSLLRPAVRR